MLALSPSELGRRMVHAEAFSRPLSRNEVVGLIFRLTIFGAVTYFTIKWMVDAIDPTRKQKVEAQKQVGFHSAVFPGDVEEWADGKLKFFSPSQGLGCWSFQGLHFVTNYNS